MRVYDPETALFFELDGPEAVPVDDSYYGAYSYDRRNQAWLYLLTYGERRPPKGLLWFRRSNKDNA